MTSPPKLNGPWSSEAEHLFLLGAIRDFHSLLSTRAATSQQMAELLDVLAQQVQEHFDNEEHGGYFADVIAAAPRLSERAAALQSEHVQMARQLVDLQGLAAAHSSGARWWQALEHGFADFMERFLAHEFAENTLLQEAYHDDIGAED